MNKISSRNCASCSLFSFYCFNLFHEAWLLMWQIGLSFYVVPIKHCHVFSSCLYIPISSTRLKAPEGKNYYPIQFCKIILWRHVLWEVQFLNSTWKAKILYGQIILGKLLEKGNFVTIFLLSSTLISFGVGTGWCIITSFICMKI